MLLDASNPRLAMSVGNVGWAPMKRNVLGQLASPPQREWIECAPGEPIQPRAFDDRFACHTVTRLSNDGAATAYVRWTVDGGGMPEWSPNGSTIFRVTAEEFTIPPGAQIDVDLYPTMTADQWSNVTGAATVIWKVDGSWPEPARVVDTTCITWRIDHPAVDDARRQLASGRTIRLARAR